MSKAEQFSVNLAGAIDREIEASDEVEAAKSTRPTHQCGSLLFAKVSNAGNLAITPGEISDGQSFCYGETALKFAEWLQDTFGEK